MDGSFGTLKEYYEKGQVQDERTEIPNITSFTNVFIEERLKKTAEIDSLVFLCEHSDEIN